MSIQTELRQSSGIAVDQGKLAFALAGVRSYAFAAVGAGDVVVTRAAERGKQLAARTQEIATGRITPTGVVADVRKAVETYLQTAGEQAATVYGQLSTRGAEVVHEFRKDPRVQRVIFRAERAVDVVEDSLEDLLDEVDNEVTEAKDAVAEGAERTRATVRKSAARNTNAAKSTTRTPPARKAPARNAAARTAPTAKTVSKAPAKAARKASNANRVSTAPAKATRKASNGSKAGRASKA